MVQGGCVGGDGKAAGKDGEDELSTLSAAVVEGAELPRKGNGVPLPQLLGKQSLPHQYRQLVALAGEPRHGQDEAVKCFSVVGVGRLGSGEHLPAQIHSVIAILHGIDHSFRFGGRFPWDTIWRRERKYALFKGLEMRYNAENERSDVRAL